MTSTQALSTSDSLLSLEQKSPGNRSSGYFSDFRVSTTSVSDTSKSLSTFEKVTQELASDEAVQKEVTLGRRIGLYRVCGELGTGNFSHVKLGVHVLTQDKVAIKILDKTKLDAKTQKLLSREVSVMERLSHPCVIRLYEVVESISKINIVMEYAPGCELFTKITNEGRLDGASSRKIFAQLVSAVGHLHDRHIVHRDLKAENIFFSGPMHIKVGDFGFSTLAKSDKMLNTFCGSPPYAAPELFQDDHYYGPQIDIWAMGVILYFMYVGVLPFRADTVGKLKRIIIACEFKFPSFLARGSLDNLACQEVISSILQLKPSQRLTIDQMRESTWLKDEDFPESLDKYEMNPRQILDSSDLNSDEREARRELNELGITESHIQKMGSEASKSPVTGVYRVILHRIHKRESGEISFSAQSTADLSDSRNNTSRPSTLRRQRSESVQKSKTQSKACAIL